MEGAFLRAAWAARRGLPSTELELLELSVPVILILLSSASSGGEQAALLFLYLLWSPSFCILTILLVENLLYFLTYRHWVPLLLRSGQTACLGAATMPATAIPHFARSLPAIPSGYYYQVLLACWMTVSFCGEQRLPCDTIVDLVACCAVCLFYSYIPTITFLGTGAFPKPSGWCCSACEFPSLQHEICLGSCSFCLLVSFYVLPDFCLGGCQHHCTCTL
jgi:hypothetical protein